MEHTAEPRFDEGLTPLKMRSLLKNLAQLRYASFKRQELFAVLQHLGWHIRPTIDVYEIEGREDYRTEKDARRRLASLQAQQVRKPARPEPGQTYIANSKYAETMYGHTITFEGWRADEAWEVSDPNRRHSFVLVPEPHARVRKRDRLQPDALKKWLLEHTDVVDQAKGAVDDIEQQRRAQVADTDSGTCGACLRNIKIEDEPGVQLPVMVLHGYRRPGTGRTHGRCLGVGYPPYELSPDATNVVYLNLDASLDALDRHIEQLISPTLTEFVEEGWGKPKVVTKTEAGASWRMLLDGHIAKQQQKRAQLRQERDIFGWLVNNWRKRELPQPGERTLDWYTEARRRLRQ